MGKVKAVISTVHRVRPRKRLLSAATLLCCSLPSALKKRHFFFFFLLELYEILDLLLCGDTAAHLCSHHGKHPACTRG